MTATKSPALAIDHQCLHAFESGLITYGVRVRVPSRFIDPWIAGLAATTVGAAGSWRPSFWFDESATIAGADRSIIDILRLVPNFDAVHGLYYLAMHAWFRLVPINEFTARLPSAIAVGVGAAGLVVLTTANRPSDRVRRGGRIHHIALHAVECG